MKPPTAHLLHKSLQLLRLIAVDRGETPLPRIAEQAGVPTSTAHRLVAVLVEEGMIVRAARGRYIVGPGAHALAGEQSMRQLLRVLAEPIVQQLARDTGYIAQLGVFESDMVTYLVKAGRRSGELFTREGMSLEAYCSGIGKVLLAHLGRDELDQYLAGGPFVALTENTITEPAHIREELTVVRQRGFAVDDREIGTDLRCVASAVRDRDGKAVAGMSISVSAAEIEIDDVIALVPRLQQSAAELEAALFPRQVSAAGEGEIQE